MYDVQTKFYNNMLTSNGEHTASALTKEAHADMNPASTFGLAMDSSSGLTTSMGKRRLGFHNTPY